MLLAEHLDRMPDGTVVVAGGGLTGIESAAEIAEQHPDLDVVLLSQAGARFDDGREGAGTAARRPRPTGCQVRAGVDIVKVMPDGVALDDGEVVAVAGRAVDDGRARFPDRRGRRAGGRRPRQDRHRRLAAVGESHPNVYAVGDAAAIRQGYGVMHGTCQSGIPTAVHAAASIVRELKGKQPKKFRFGYVHQPVSLGRNDAVIQFTHADDSPGAVLLGRPDWPSRTKKR